MSQTSPTKPDLPAEIRAEIARRGWSVRTLAEHSGIKYATLSRRLAGDGNLTIAELSAVAVAFGLAPSTLMTRAEDVAA